MVTQKGDMFPRPVKFLFYFLFLFVYVDLRVGRHPNAKGSRVKFVGCVHMTACNACMCVYMYVCMYVCIGGCVVCDVCGEWVVSV